MALDPDLLSEAKIAEADLVEAEHAAEVARAEFNRAVRRLHLAGASLREIATALGLSHQRVHQIVEAAGGSRRWRKGAKTPRSRALLVLRAQRRAGEEAHRGPRRLHL